MFEVDLQNIFLSEPNFGTGLTELPMPIVPELAKPDESKKEKGRKSTHHEKPRKRPTSVATNSSILGLPLPTPPVGAEYPPEPVDIKKPAICGPRMHEYNSDQDDWGSQFVENYELGDVIGEGTFGQVFKARDKRTEKIVALKKVRLDKEREGFPVTTVREIKILRQLDDHENIIKLREIVTDKLNVTDYRKWKVC
mgnify:CR=1 FL=1